MLPVAVEDTMSQLITHVCYFLIKKNKVYTPPDKLTQIGIPEEEPLMVRSAMYTQLYIFLFLNHN